MQHSVTKIAFILFLLHASYGFAQSYSIGYKSYVRGDYTSAEQAFRKALRNTTSATEKSRIYKMMGISQYMLGKRIEAADSFKFAKQQNPRISILPSEVLDESVVSFFSSIEGPKPEPAAAPSAVVVPATPPAPPPLPRGRANTTSMRIQGNVPEAELVVNGSIRTFVNKEVYLEPGIHEIEISAKGYQTVKQPVEVQPGRLNVFTVNLTSESPSTLLKPRVKKNKLKKSTAKIKTRKRRVRKKVKKSKYSPKWYYALPLGVGQFDRGEYIWGSFYAFAQLGATAMGVTNWSKGDKIVTETNSELDERETILAGLPTFEEQKAYFETEIEGYKASQDEASAKAYNQAFIGFGIAGAFYLSSVLHAFLAGPPDSYVKKKSAKKKRKKRKKRKTSALHPDQYQLLLSPAVSGARPSDLMLQLGFSWDL